MEETLTRPRQSYVFDPEGGFDHKLTNEEIRELLDNFDYDAWLDDYDEDGEPEPVWDRFGNPTRDTIASKYEMEHGLYEITTVEEAIEEIHAACREGQGLQERY